jgi:hypothetical protein
MSDSKNSEVITAAAERLSVDAEHHLEAEIVYLGAEKRPSYRAA